MVVLIFVPQVMFRREDLKDVNMFADSMFSILPLKFSQLLIIKAAILGKPRPVAFL